MRAPIELFFDYISPYAYIAWKKLPELAQAEGRSLIVRPTLLAPLLAAGNTRGPAEIPAKRRYIGKDLLRVTRLLGLPFGMPPAHPFNPLLALRVTGLPMDEDARQRIVDLFFDEVWGGAGRGIDSKERVVATLSGGGFDGPKLVALAESSDAKDRLRRTTEEAITLGVFGVPTMLADGELFWGYDSFPHLLRRLRGEDPIDEGEALLRAWAALPAAVVRKEAR